MRARRFTPFAPLALALALAGCEEPDPDRFGETPPTPEDVDLLDDTFGANGSTMIRTQRFGRFLDAALSPTGEIYLAVADLDRSQDVIFRIDPDGIVSDSFAGFGVLVSPATGSGGTQLVVDDAGKLSLVYACASLCVSRYDRDGAPEGLVTIASEPLTVLDAKPTPGKGMAILVDRGADVPASVFRLDAQGGLETSFAGGMADVGLDVSRIAFDAASAKTTVVRHNGTLIRLDATGARDPSFGIDGVTWFYRLDEETFSPIPMSATPLSDDRLLVVGSIGPGYATIEHPWVTLLGRDGSPAHDFGDAGFSVLGLGERVGGYASKAVVQPDGKIVVGGSGGGGLDAFLTRLTPSGQLDPSFSGGRPVYFPSPAAWGWEELLLGADGKVTAIGTAEPSEGRIVIARYRSP